MSVTSREPRAMRVWDRFLSERDHAHLAAGFRKEAPFGLGDRPAVLVIDDFASTLGERSDDVVAAVADGRERCGTEGWDAIDCTKELLETARACGVRVVHTTIEDPVPRAVFGQIVAAYEFHPEVAPEGDELVIRKSFASAFQGTSLVGHLVARGIDTVVLCGNSTSGCVRATTVDAAALGFHVAVVEDCVFDRTEASHAINLFDMEQKYADVIRLDEAMSYLLRCGEASDA